MKLFKRKQKTDLELYDIIHDKFSKITRREIEMTRQKLDEEFQKLISQIDADSDQTLSVERAEELLMNLLSICVSRRQQLADCLKSNVESGHIFDYYDEMIEEIDVLQVEVYKKLRDKRYLQKEYEYENGIYNRVVDHTYQSSYVPGTNDLSFYDREKSDFEDELLKALYGGMEGDDYA